MKVLVVGSGAREHALVWKCVQSDLVERVYCAPGNGGTGGMARNVPIGAADVVRLVDFARRERLGLIVLGPEASVDAAVGDALRHAGFNVFGPNQAAGRIESSKAFAKALMRRAEIPTADFDVFTQPAPAKEWARARGGQVAVKADGLARGKGVIVCASADESDKAVDAMLVEQRFGRSGATIVVEERLEGPELSLLVITDGIDVIPLAPARDYKRALDGDRGGNTGGMGAYSPPKGVDDAVVSEVVDCVMKPAVAELASSGHAFRGVRRCLTEERLSRISCARCTSAARASRFSTRSSTRQRVRSSPTPRPCWWRTTTRKASRCRFRPRPARCSNERAYNRCMVYIFGKDT